MQNLESHIDKNGSTFKANRDRMQQLVAELRARIADRAGGRRRRNTSQRHREQGKMPVRERIERLVDPRVAVSGALAARRARACTRTTLRAPASSQASGACPGARSSSSPTMRR